MNNKEDNLSAELSAIKSVYEALEKLNNEQRNMVLDYVSKSLGFNINKQKTQNPTPSTTEIKEQVEKNTEVSATNEVMDIRTFKEKKCPKNAQHMAVVVAYYLKYVAPTEEQKDTITTADIDEYFHLAKFNKPSNTGVLLNDTKRSGYIKSTGTRGEYELTPVGYNLVSIKMPLKDGVSKKKKSVSSKRKKKGSK